MNAQGELPAYVLDPSIERAIESTIEHAELNSVITMAPEGIRDIIGRLGRKIDKAESAVVIASAGSRYFLRQIVESALPNLTVLSQNEISPEVKVRSRGVIE
jgi:flagellar biosynthesis protein FlhA